MRLPAARPRRPSEPTGPLVDIVFLLLVFFLLAGTLETAPPFALTPPVADSGRASAGTPLRVFVGPDGRIAFEGRALAPEELARALAQRLGERDASPRVRIEADGGVATGEVLALLKRLDRAGVTHLELLTVPGRRGA